LREREREKRQIKRKKKRGKKKTIWDKDLSVLACVKTCEYADR